MSMSNVDTNRPTKPPYGGNVEEPSVKKLKTLDVDEKLRNSCSDVLGTSVKERSFEDIHGFHCFQNGKHSPNISNVKSEVADGKTELPTSAVNEDTLTGREVTDKELVLSGVGFTSTSFIGPLCQPKIVKSETAIENELDKFYKELEQIAPEDIDTPDDSCNADKSTIEKRQQCPALEQETQSNFSRPIRNHAPHPGQLWRNKPETLRRLQPHFKHWNALCPPPLQGSYSSILDCAADMRPERHLYQCPFPVLPPPPRILSYPLDDGSSDNFWDPNQKNLQWENMPFKSDYEIQGDYANCDNQGHYKFIPNEFDCKEPHTSKPDCSQHYGQPSYFCQTNPGEYNQQAHHHPGPIINPDSFMLVLMRGAPGSGKSTMARKLLLSGPNGLILSTDDYFLQEGQYVYDPRLLGDAHYWNQNRTQEALFECRSPIIIDNTNMQAWEMKPYVQMAIERGYKVCFCEPNTSWKYQPSELERRNKHGVPKHKIAKMLERFELPMTVDIVLSSQEPPRQSTEHASKPQRKRRHDISDF